jgi:hypothetical protein
MNSNISQNPGRKKCFIFMGGSYGVSGVGVSGVGVSGVGVSGVGVSGVRWWSASVLLACRLAAGAPFLAM